MAVKVTKGQISDGTISKNTCIEEYYLCGKFHGFMKKCTIFWLCRYTTTRVIEAKIMRRHVSSLMCRLCGEFEETIVHLMAACPSLAASEYLYRHNVVAGVIHWLAPG